jgi:hypothetical protein
MLTVLVRPVPIFDGLKVAGVKALPPTHEYWTIGFALNEIVENAFLESGFLHVTFDERYGIVSGSVVEWHAAVSGFLKSTDTYVRKLGTILVQTLPDLFRNLSTKLNTDGTLCLR